MKTVVCLSGTLCDESMWSSQKTILEKKYRFVFPSISTHRDIESLARSILLNLPEKFILMGFSAGVVVSLEILRQAKSRVEKLIFLAGRADGGNESLSNSLLESLKEMRSMGIEEYFEQILLPKSLSKESLENDSIKNSIKEMACKVGLDNFENQVFMLNTRKNALDLVSEIEIPILLISGSEDRICPLEYQEEINKLAFNSEIVILKNTGHYLSIESPEILNEVLLNFL